MKRIGERIKRRREQLSLQLNDLAKKVGISPSALSQIEKSKAFPSIITLKSIAENLNTTVGELIGENESFSNNPVVRREDIKFIESNNSGTEAYFLSHHDLNKQMDTYLIRFIKNSDIEGLFNNNGQVFCHVQSGEIEFYLDNQQYFLHAGDTIYFNSKHPHSARNISESTGEMVWVNSVSGF